MTARAEPGGAVAVRVLVVCTGNAARSVMAGFMLERVAAAEGLALEVATAGTHTLDGQPASQRTRQALTTIPELADAPIGRHRSRQLTPELVEWADLVVGMEADHVRFVRRLHAGAADRAATLRRLAAELPPGPGPLDVRVARLGLAEVEVDDVEDVADPAGRELDVYDACAREIWALVRDLVPRLGPGDDHAAGGPGS